MKSPFPFQRDAYEIMAARPYILADECGLGKTLMAIEAVKYRRKITTSGVGTGPTLVLCPYGIKGQWEKEILEQTDNQEQVIVTGTAGRMPEGFKLEWLFRPIRQPAWVIMHYEGLLRQWPKLRQYLWSNIICDEGHRIKNRKAKRTVFLKQIGADHKMALTGTPMHKNPADLWSVLNWLYPDRFRSYWQFFETFVDYWVNPVLNYREIRGVKNKEKLARLLGPIFLRRTKAEVAPNLPPRIHQEYKLEMGRDQARIYEQIKKAKDVLVPVGDTESEELLIPNVLARIVRLQQVLTDPGMDPINQRVASCKLDWVREFINDNEGTPMLIFSRFREPVLKLAEEFDAAVRVGSKGSIRIKKGTDDFREGKCDILCGTIDALGEGPDLGRASCAVFIDQHWSSRAMQQAYDRIHRITADEPKHIITLRVPKTVDDLVLKSLKNAWTTQELVYNALKEWEE
jgi:SNF2 family DNA or RNA helicase